MDANRYNVYRERAKTAIQISAVLFVLCLFVVLNYNDKEGLMITGIVGLTLSGMGVLTGFYLRVYFKDYEQALLRFNMMPAIARWIISETDSREYVKAEKSQRLKAYRKYWLMAPVLLLVIALTLFAEIDDLKLDSTLVYLTLGAFVLCMVLLYFNMRSNSLKKDLKDGFQIEIKTSGVSINGNVTIWGKLIKDSHQSLKDSMWGALSMIAEADRKILSIVSVAEMGCHYIVIEYKLDTNNQNTLYVPVPQSEVENITAVIQAIFDGNEERENSVLPTDQKVYNTKKIAKWSIAVITSGSMVFGVYQYGWPTYNAIMADDKFEKATAMFGRQQYDSAFVVYKEVVGHYEDYPEAYINMGQIKISKNDLDSALVLYDKALSLRPNYDLALFNKGYVFYSQEKYEEAIQNFQSYHAVNTGDGDSYIYLGDCYFLTQQRDSARKYYDKAYVSGYRSAGLSFNRAELLNDLNETQLAVDSYMECLQQDSTYANAWFSLAALMEKQGKMLEANQFNYKGSLLVE